MELYDFHDVAKIFPLMGDAKLAELKETSKPTA